MPLNDTRGRTWAHESTVKAGDVLIADGGFTCIADGAELTVQRDPEHEGIEGLFVPCKDGHHGLSGQLDFDGCGALVGLYPKPQ